MMQTESTITCPMRGHRAIEQMPTNACQFFYDRKGCGERLKPLAARLSRILLLRLSPVPAASIRALLRLTP
jgi:hypothetical protein